MANLGLRKTHLYYDLNDLKIYLNICPIDKNTLYSVNLFSSSPSLQMPCSLIYNKQSINEDGLFGYGYKLSYYKKLTSINNIFKLEESDGNIYEFTPIGNNLYKNDLLESTITIDDSEYPYILTDKYKNEYCYSSLNNEYPDIIKLSSGKDYHLGYNQEGRVLGYYDGFNYEIRFIYNSNNKVQVLQYIYGGHILYNTEFEYTNGLIRSIKINKFYDDYETETFESELVGYYTFSYNNDSITDNINQDIISFFETNNIINVYKNNINISTITINNDYSVEKDLILNTYKKYSFDEACNIFSLESGRINSSNLEVPLDYKCNYYRCDYDLLKHESYIPYSAISDTIDTLSTYTSSFENTISGLTINKSYILAFKYMNKATLSFGENTINLPNRSEATLALIGFKAQSSDITLSFSNINGIFYISSNIEKYNYTSFKSYYYSDEDNPSTSVRNLIKTSDSNGDITYSYTEYNMILS